MALPTQPQFIQQPQILLQPAQIMTAQQPQVMYQDQVVTTSCCIPSKKSLPFKLQPAQFGLGILLVLIGLTSLLVGIIGFFTNSYLYTYQGISYNSTYYIYNMTPWIGADIWAGVFYLLGGIFALTTRKKENSIHLINCFYAFCIISIILSVPHIGVSFGFIFSYGTYHSIWFNIVSLGLGVIGFAVSLACIVLLSKEIYCEASPKDFNSAQYQATNQVVAIQLDTNQQGNDYLNVKYGNVL
ncbi:hypothetical protein TrispH2_008326 [Trichoplax sp. H2]|nr:hypothetical protein TrispH2_008326 [Trichoplax sp. H2]|eukprot:RDD39336.1 hypothetical protein TrispH2_008326 [Trichoplax sp. H2]